MKTLDMELFAKRLKEARQNKGIKQKELSELTGISVAMLSAYENPNAKAGKNPTLSTAYTLANALDVSIDWLCGNDLDRSTKNTEYMLKGLTMLIYHGNGAILSHYGMSSERLGEDFYDLIIPINHNSPLFDFVDKSTELLEIIGKNVLTPDMIKTLKLSNIDKYKNTPWQDMFFPKEGEPNGNNQTEE